MIAPVSEHDSRRWASELDPRENEKNTENDENKDYSARNPGTEQDLCDKW
jgi:hypothetical protein